MILWGLPGGKTTIANIIAHTLMSLYAERHLIGVKEVITPTTRRAKKQRNVILFIDSTHQLQQYQQDACSELWRKASSPHRRRHHRKPFPE